MEKRDQKKEWVRSDLDVARIRRRSAVTIVAKKQVDYTGAKSKSIGDLGCEIFLESDLFLSSVYSMIATFGRAKK